MDNKELNLPGLIAHRGYSSHFPENTLRAFQEAFVAGACFVECDVQLTRDQVPVVLHDSNLLRSSGVFASVSKMEFADLEKFAAAYKEKFGDQFSDEEVPSLGDFAGLLKQWPNSKAFVEIKRSSIRKFGAQVVLERLLPVIENIGDQIVIISFDYGIIERLVSEGKWKTGWVVEHWSEKILSKVRKLNPDYFFVDVDCIPSKLSQLPDSSWYWVVYTIDDPVLATEWVGRGADFIETNDIKELLQADAFKNSGCLE